MTNDEIKRLRLTWAENNRRGLEMGVLVFRLLDDLEAAAFQDNARREEMDILARERDDALRLYHELSDAIQNLLKAPHNSFNDAVWREKIKGLQTPEVKRKDVPVAPKQWDPKTHMNDGIFRCAAHGKTSCVDCEFNC